MNSCQLIKTFNHMLTSINLSVPLFTCKPFTLLTFLKSDGAKLKEHGTKHPCIKGNDVCSNVGLCSLRKENNYDKMKKGFR